MVIGMRIKQLCNRYLVLLKMGIKRDPRDLPLDRTNLNPYRDRHILRTHRCTRTICREVYLVTYCCNHHNQDLQGDYHYHCHKEKSFKDNLMVVIFLRILLLFHYYKIKDLLLVVHRHIHQLQ